MTRVSTPIALQSYWSIHALWQGAGADPAEGLEAMLEWLAYTRLRDAKGMPTAEGELTAGLWSRIRDAVTHTLSLPNHAEGSNAHVRHTPGLFEQTRRFADAFNDAIDGKHSSRPFADLLAYLMHAPQAGARRSALAAFLWPDYLSELFLALLNERAEKSLYVPYDSSGWLPLVLARAGWNVECEVANEQSARILGLYSFLAEWDLKAHVSDPLRHPSLHDGAHLRRFAQSAAIATFGLRLPNEAEADPYHRFPVRLLYGEARQLAHLIAQTDGQIAIIVPESFLFRSTGGERDYKEQLVRRGMLSAVIRLPRSTFSPYTNLQTSMLILDTQRMKQSGVLFVDASDDLLRKPEQAYDSSAVRLVVQIVTSRKETAISRCANYDAISRHDFNISVDRYVQSDQVQQIATLLDSASTVELGDIAEIIRPQSFALSDADAVETFLEVTLQDIEQDGQIRTPSKRLEIGERMLGKLLKQRLSANDLLLSVRGRIGAVGMIRDIEMLDQSAGWLASQAFVIVRLRETSPIRLLSLYRYLSSPLGQELLQSAATGMTVPMISMGDIKKLRIIVPTKEEEREIGAQYDKLLSLRNQIHHLEAEAEALNSSTWPMTKTAVKKPRNKVR